MIVDLNNEQLKWLKQIVLFRLEDEMKEKADLESCKRDECIADCQQRIDMWQSIMDALSKDVE